MVKFILHVGFSRHPKVIRLAVALNLSRRDAVGVLTMLFEAVAEHCDDGELSTTEPAMLATWCDWPIAEAPKLWDALATCGWIDCDEAGAHVHDWAEYYSKTFSERQRKREQRAAEKAGPSTDRARTVHGQGADRPRTGRGPSADRARTGRGPSAAPSTSRARTADQDLERDLREEDKPPYPPDEQGGTCVAISPADSSAEEGGPPPSESALEVAIIAQWGRLADQFQEVAMCRGTVSASVRKVVRGVWQDFGPDFWPTLERALQDCRRVQTPTRWTPWPDITLPRLCKIKRREEPRDSLLARLCAGEFADPERVRARDRAHRKGSGEGDEAKARAERETRMRLHALSIAARQQWGVGETCRVHYGGKKGRGTVESWDDENQVTVAFKRGGTATVPGWFLFDKQQVNNFEQEASSVKSA